MLPTANPTVICKALSEGAVLFSMPDEVYYGLNDLGAQVWGLLDGADDLDALIGTLSVTYPDVSADTIRADVVELLDELTRFGLVTYSVSEHPEAERVDASRAQAGGAEASRVA